MKNRLSVAYFYSKIIVEEIKLSSLVQFHSVISFAVVVNTEYKTNGFPTWLGSCELVPWNTVSVKMVGTLWGLLVPSMLVYKIW